MSGVNITVYDGKNASEAAQRAEAAAREAKEQASVTSGALTDPIPPGTESEPAVLPPGPAGQKVKFEPEPGFYQGFEEVTSDKRWYFYWSGTEWSLKELGELPSNSLADDFGESVDEGATQRLVTALRDKIGEVEGEIPDVSGLATKSELTYKIPYLESDLYSGGFIDEENKVLLGFDKQGKLVSVQFGQEVIDFSALKNVAISYQDLSEGVTSLMYSSEDNTEYSLAFIDEEDKVLLGVKKDGRVIAGGVDITALNDAVSTLVVENEKVIVCLGDSLTAGAGGGGTRYTTVLQTLVGSDYLVANRGVGGENVPTIAARQGSVPSVLPFDVVLPASASTTVQVATNSTRLHNMLFPEVSISPLLQGNTTNVNPVYVDNIECTLIREGEGTGVNWSLKRNINGSSDAILKQGTPILMRDAYTYHAPYAAIIFVGQNGGYSSSTENLIDYQKRIVDFYGTSNYLILGLTSGTAESREELENAQLASFGNRYVNLRHLISKYGLIDADLEPTQDDIDAMAVGSIPPSLLFDAVHFNAYGYTVIGKYVNDRLKQLNII